MLNAYTKTRRAPASQACSVCAAPSFDTPAFENVTHFVTITHSR